jgi:hypothetical protein
LKSNLSSKVLQKRKKKLETIATRIERKMTKLEKILTNLSRNP